MRRLSGNESVWCASRRILRALFIAYNFPRRFLQRTLLPRFGIYPYSSCSRKNTANDLGRSVT